MSFLRTRTGSLILLAAAFSLIYNPFTKFPYTFMVIIVFVLAVTSWQHGSLNVLGIKKLTLKEIRIAIVAFACLELVMDFAIQPAIEHLFREPANYTAFGPLERNLPKYLKFLGFMWISAAVGEELLFRGFAMLQLETIFGKNNVASVILSSTLFAVAHWSQGPTGVLVTFTFGLVFASVYLKWRNIWINVIVHGLVDTFFLTMAYFGMLSYFG